MDLFRAVGEQLTAGVEASLIKPDNTAVPHHADWRWFDREPPLMGGSRRLAAFFFFWVPRVRRAICECASASSPARSKGLICSAPSFISPSGCLAPLLFPKMFAIGSSDDIRTCLFPPRGMRGPAISDGCQPRLESGEPASR